jgi:O-antigen ligase
LSQKYAQRWLGIRVFDQVPQRSPLTRFSSILGGTPILKVVSILTAILLGFQTGGSSQTWFAIVLGGFIVLGVFLFSYLRPKRALLLYLGALPFLPFYVGRELPLLREVPAPRAVGAVVLVGVLLGLLRKSEKSLLRSPLLWICMAYAVDLALIQTMLLAGGSLTNSLLKVPFWLFIDTLGPALLVSECAQDESWRRSLLRVLFISGSIAALLAMYESLTGINVFASLPWQFSKSSDFSYTLWSWPKRFGFTRALGAIGQPSYFGWLFATLFVVAICAYAYAWPRRTGWQWHASGILIVTLSALGLFSSASGVPFMGMLAGMGTLILLQPRMLLRSRTVGILLVILVLLIALPFSTQIKDLWSSFLGMGTSQEPGRLEIQANTAGRFLIPDLTWSTIKDSFIVGQGTVETSGVFNFAPDVCNRYIVELINGGLIGLLLWILPIGLAVRRAGIYYRQNTDAERKVLALAILSALVVGLVVFNGIAYGNQSETLFWVIVGLAWALPLAESKQEN